MVKLHKLYFPGKQGNLPRVEFEKIALNTGEGRVISPKKTARQGVFQEMWDFWRSFGYVGTWLNISKLLGRTSNQEVFKGRVKTP